VSSRAIAHIHTPFDGLDHPHKWATTTTKGKTIAEQPTDQARCGQREQPIRPASSAIYGVHVPHHGYPLDPGGPPTRGAFRAVARAARSVPAPVLAFPSFRLFDPPRVGNTYAYAPSSITDVPSDYHFYCGNRGRSSLVDQIYVRHYVFDGANWLLAGDRRVLAPTRNTWDARHICDPSVVAGSFSLKGVGYRYAMFYTGTRDPLNNGTHNHVGVAVSNDLLTWVKRTQPLVTRNPHEVWGVGQPSATSIVDGQVLLFYTRSNPTTTYVQHLDLADVDAPIVLGEEWGVSGAGLTTLPNGQQSVNNGDFAYDPVRDRFWVVRASSFDATSPDWVATDVELAWIPGADIWAGTGTWTPVARINVDVTGRSKNDNAGIQRSVYGTLVDPTNIRINVTSFDAAPWPDALWTYRLHSLFVPVDP
jgi:hypothetical protein